MANNNKNKFLALSLLLLPLLSGASVDLYLDGEQTEALFGIRRAEGIYYVKDGVVNHYALGFQEQVTKDRLLINDVERN